MRIAYVAHSRFPTEKAHGLQIAAVCSAMASLGHEVSIVAPTIRNNVAQTPQAYYGLPPEVTVCFLPHFDASASRFIPQRLWAFITTFFYRRALAAFLRTQRSDLLYLRSPHVLRTAVASGIPVVLELHTLPRWGRSSFVAACDRCARVVCLTSPMRDELLSWGARSERVIVEGDAVDLRPFKSAPESPAAKERWRLPADRPVVGYVGSLVTRDMEKGVRELLTALAALKERGVAFQGWIVGGPDDWAERYRNYARKIGIAAEIRLEGRIAPVDVPSALRACDVLVYPAPASAHPYFLRDTSPLKIFEYLASRRPVVCADLPPVRDVVDDAVARLCPPGDPAALADALQDVLRDAPAAAERAEKGWERVQSHTWRKRMERILDRLS